MALYHLVNTLTNDAGDALVGYYVRLRDRTSGLVATLYADSDGTVAIDAVSGAVNAAKTDSTGLYSIYVEDGSYDIQIYDKNDIDNLLRIIEDIPMFGGATADAVAADAASASADAASASADADAAAASVVDAVAAAADAEAFAAALALVSGGYIGIEDSTPPAGVAEGEGYFYTLGGRLYGALNTGGVADNQFEVATAALVTALGNAVPTGGTTGQVLAKVDGTDFNTEWADVASSGAAAPSFIYQNADRTLTNTASSQKLFDQSTNGRITLTTGLYEFWAIMVLQSMDATSGNALFNLLGAGTAVCAGQLAQVVGVDAAAATSANNRTGTGILGSNSTASSMVSGGTGAQMLAEIKGVFKVTTAGTLIPSITLANAAAAVLKAGATIIIRKLAEAGTYTSTDVD